jgi:hypothetical protein
MLQAGPNERDENKFSNDDIKRKLTHRDTHIELKTKKKLLQRNDYFYFTPRHKKVDSNLPLLNKNVHSPW